MGKRFVEHDGIAEAVEENVAQDISIRHIWWWTGPARATSSDVAIESIEIGFSEGGFSAGGLEGEPEFRGED